MHILNYPYLRPIEWIAPIGFAVGGIFNILEVLVFTNPTYFERFSGTESVPDDIVRPGVILIDEGYFQRYIKALSEYSVLAFTRKRNLTERWEIHMLTTLDGVGRIGPTQLHKIQERVRLYLTEAQKEGALGIVVFEGVEYLLM